MIERLPDGRECILGVGFTDAPGYPDDSQLWAPKRWAVLLTHEDVLVDGVWREVAPAEPTDHGVVGGDGQLSTAWGRRFARRMPDGLWAVIDHFFYVETDVMHESGERWLTEGIWRTACRDLRDVGGTEEWADTPEYKGLDTVGEVTDRDAYGRCDLLTGEYDWNGESLVR
ncbi:hypothetical protein [Micromonospora sp. NPDC047730]|uniref:hypothetical protein n=1 Tax=Micromonospora sp. NPDC047730 TaxID=3364253 RepID=UPI00371D9FC8